MVQGKKCLAVHSALPPIVFVFLPERIGGEQEHAAEENVQQDKRDVHGNETVNHADGYGFHPISKFGKRSIPELTGCAAGHVDACWL